MSATIIKRTEEGRALEYRCHCGATFEGNGPGRDIDCPKCGSEFNSSGQQLAPRSQWGEETGETAADFDRGMNDPEHAFDGDY